MIVTDFGKNARLYLKILNIFKKEWTNEQEKYKIWIGQISSWRSLCCVQRFLCGKGVEQ